MWSRWEPTFSASSSLLRNFRSITLLSFALFAVEDEEDVTPDVRAQYIGVIREEFREAGEQFRRYRAEVGLPDRPSSKPA